MKQKSNLPSYIKIVCIVDLLCLMIGIALAFSNIGKDLTLMLIGFALLAVGIIGIFVICIMLEKRKKR